ncbi:hypothetical protein [Agrococcus baldri]|uniref:Uncharacterized protein n=1 Tax=Agrococcus baldri TaxID=153730 RepID=A0AA87RCQ7_9MICO|nr:hypothetical protein [Agrococcus baldri]GEK80584.1 hypothetical protein ABA31_19350 [Agrococcus baldri]
MREDMPPRGHVARALNRIDTAWDRVWSERLAHYSRHRALEIAATLLGGQEPRYAEVAVDESDEQAPSFELVVIADDRIVQVVGPINDDVWPVGELFPRHELRRLELRKTRLESVSSQEPRSESAAVTLHFDAADIGLPLSSDPMGQAAKALADHVADLIADRMGGSGAEGAPASP